MINCHIISQRKIALTHLNSIDAFIELWEVTYPILQLLIKKLLLDYFLYFFENIPQGLLLECEFFSPNIQVKKSLNILN
jgi:hypothetical protein